MTENLFENIEKEPVSEKDIIEDTTEEDSVFDYNVLPDSPLVKYERVELDGKTITIKKAVIEKPGLDVEWKKTLNGNAYFKPYMFRVEYDTENNDREYLSGLKGFKQDNGEISNPTMFVSGKNQVAKLFGKYKKFVIETGVSEKEFDEKYGLKRFMSFLNSNPKVVIETVDIEFQGKTHRKNLVKEFMR